LFTEIIK